MHNAMLLAAALTANFAAETGPVRPEIHSSGFGPTICSQTAQDLSDVKAMGFKYARTYDWALNGPKTLVSDRPLVKCEDEEVYEFYRRHYGINPKATW